MSDTADTDTPAFNYEAVLINPANAAELRRIALSIRQSGHDAFLETGRQLTKVKPWFAHGDFTDWVESECGIGMRTAQKAMQVAKVVQKAPNLALLSIDALLAYAAVDKKGADNKGVPKRTLNRIVEKIDKGEIPTANEIRVALAPKGSGASKGKPPTQPLRSLGSGTMAATAPAAPVTLLQVLVATWNDADEECRGQFRQHIGCTCAGAKPAG
jgi:hypothetical protein